MKKILISVLLMVCLLMSAVACGDKTDNNNNLPTEDNKIHLYILTGQSGARGKAVNTDLSEEQKETNYDVDIIAEGLMMPQLNRIPETISDTAAIEFLEPGFGDSTAEFGPELGMGETLASRFPKDGDTYKSVIVKYTACGSTFTDHWYSKSMIEDEEVAASLQLAQMRENPKTGEMTGPLTNNLYQLIDRAIEILEAEGYETVIDGAAFVHGEQDAKFDVNMQIYEKALEYFITDLREYVGVNNLPVVVTEALTNSANYSNELRAIQKRIADKMSGVSLVPATDLYTNTFEPWHFGAESNFVLGNRIAAEIISLNDTRKVEAFEDVTVQVPTAQVTLPAYLKATFTNGYTGYVKVTYTGTYDEKTLGQQTVPFTADLGEGKYEGALKVNVVAEPFVDGILNEYANVKKNTVAGIGDIYVVRGATGLYIAADIKDTTLRTDGESWKVGDMGQSGVNDDFQVFVATTSADTRMTLCLSAANLLRVYKPGTAASAFTPANNMVYLGTLNNYKYHVTTYGIANDENQASEGFVLEMFVSYEDLGVSVPSDIMLCFLYSDVSVENGKKVINNVYYSKNEVANPETDIANYISSCDMIR